MSDYWTSTKQHSEPLTINKIEATIKTLNLRSKEPSRIIESPSAVKVVGLRFPKSRHRSARIHKKLVKRLGPQEITKPTTFKTPDAFIVHPEIMDGLRGGISDGQKKMIDHAFSGK